MAEKLIALINRHDFFILTTHDPADADGIGAELVLARILRERGKQAHIINASPMPHQFWFMDPLGQVMQWDGERHGPLLEQGALVIVDAAKESSLGQMGEEVGRSMEVFVIDHHEPASEEVHFSGIYDPSAASVCEMVVELAEAAGVTLDQMTALAAYAGIAYDTGFFAYPKTGSRTFRVALSLLDLGVNPNEIFTQFCQNAPARVLHLQQKALQSMAFHYGDRIATQTLLREDFAETGALPEDTDGFVNFPLKSRDIVVSLLLKETPDKKVHCSLRSKGTINVAKVAQQFGGGGHTNAAGFKNKLGIEQVLSETLAQIIKHLDGQ
ncbi:MAG: bifunctional oligoribonuclease/PAP phosphatase NrnA [Treponema sp.]|jgi:phosphoesterase RecJ-like protein|nr:bifunctional oligoribonuclease/PAP phosphatase NrnA [Treponema sp.]